MLLGFVRALKIAIVSCQTSWNKFNAGLQDSFLEGIILSTSALVS